MSVLQSTLKLTLLSNIEQRAKAINRSLDAINKHARGFVATSRNIAAFAATYIGVTEGIEHTYTAASKMQASLTEIGIKAGLSNQHLEAMQRQLTALSPKVNQTTADLLSGVDAMVTLGLEADKAQTAIPFIAKAATATGASIADLAGASTSAIQNMKVAPEQIKQMLDAMALAGNAGAFELKDMATYFPQLTVSAQALGIDGVDGVADLAAALQIARRGAGDASTAANNLANFLGKIMSPEVRKNFKKFGVDVTKELKKAHKQGVSPLEHFIKLVDEKTKGGQADLLGQLFGDKQVQDFVRPMIADLKDYIRIREEAERANGTVDSAFAKRMEDNAQKVKAFKIAVQNLGTSIGATMLGPVADVADHLAEIFNTLDERATVFDRIGASVDGFLSGLGVDGAKSFGEAMKSVEEFLFGVKDGSKAADEIGGIFAKFQEYGRQVRQFGNDIADAVAKVEKFFGLKPGAIKDTVADIGSWGFTLGAASIGIGLAAGAIGGLAKALFKLSGASLAIGGAKGLAKLFAAIGGFKAPKGIISNVPKTPPTPNSLGIFGILGSRATLWSTAAIALYEALTSIPTEGYASAQRNNPELLQDLERQRRIRSEFKGGFEGGRHAAYAGVGPRPGDAVSGEITNWPTGYRPMTGLEEHPGKRRDDAGMGAVNQFRTILDSVRDLFGSSTAQPGASKTVSIDATSISAMIQPSGVQSVRVENQQTPNVTVNNSIVVNGVMNPEAAAASAASQIGEKVKNAVESANTD